MSANAQAAGRYYARKNNRVNAAYFVASALFSNQSNGDTITINGVLVTFGPTHNVAIGSTANATLLNLQTYLENLNNVATNNLIFTVTGGNTLSIYSVPVNAPAITVTASAAAVTAATTAQATTRARIPL